MALAHAWTAVLGLEPERRAALGRAARTRIESNYSLDQVARSYEALFTTAVDGAACK